MNVLFTSDWHLGKILHEHSLIDDQSYFLEWLIQYLHEHPHDLLVIPGDIYDRSVPTAEAITLFSAFLHKLHNLVKIPVIIIPGNHDSLSRLSFLSEVISTLNIHICCNLENATRPLVFKKGDTTLHVYAVPFLEPHSAELPLPTETKIATHEEALLSVCNKIYPALSETAFNLFVGHLFTTGAEVCDSERTFVGTSGEVSRSLFEPFDFTALGHLHRPQKVTDKIWYTGSPLKYSFSESSDKKRLLSLNIAKKEFVLTTPEIPYKRELSKISGTIEDLLSSPDFAPFEESYLEILLKNKEVVIDAASRLKTRFKNILSIRREEMNSQNQSLIGDYENKNDVTSDFRNFENFLYGEDNLMIEAKLQLFQTFVSKIGSEEGA